MRWDNQEIILFLGLYKKQSLLWDPTNPDYTKRDMKDEALNALILEMHDSGLKIDGKDHLKMKIKSIRDTYRNEMNKVTRANQDGRKFVPKLAWFSVANSFLQNLSLPNKSAQTSTKLPEGSQPVMEVTELDLKPFMADVADDGSISSANEENIDDESYSPDFKSKELFTVKLKRKLSNPKASTSAKISRTDPLSLENTSKVITSNEDSCQVSKDDCVLFSEYIASHLRQLPLRSFLSVQAKIQEIILAERLRCLDNL